MAEGKAQNNIFGEISPILNFNSTGTQLFEITSQKAYRLGNIIYIYIILHKISSITPSREYSIGTCSIIPKGNVVISQYGGFNSMVIQDSGNIIFVDNTDTRNWYNLSGSFVA